ncbi:cell wall-binding repeat-containing protein [Desulfosporosinus nitroreducens]|uniref:Cell wall-binding repeat-containing protein n=1 Tax=Desulfosporosinus nitroreducens TaxID=2018668 RepID=A0ABT8QSQ8_9FIRM|nr:cell wall-binding repeat-containing protein [Desulfosporosinus nitroreducens]MDO0824397.1 cell wall-binding repeat-containing protein [Desulfosporosinus nitroreducens]
MKKTKKALASLAIAGMTLSLIPFNVFAATTVPTRIAGVTAEQTAVNIADQTGYTGAAILASSASYGMVDALTAGPLAASLKAPILLTGAGNTLDAATKAELTKLAVKTVYVTSGTAVIKQGVIDELKAMGIEVVSLGGYDRAETSVNIAKKMTGVTKVAVANTVVDALSIASVASAANQPILLTDKDALPASVAAYLAANSSIAASDVIGGTGVISDAVKAGLPAATRHAGMSAYDTNNQVIQDFASALAFENVYVANGITGIDALAGAPLAAQTKSAIVLTDGKTVPAAAAFTYSKATATTVVTALGGEYVVPESVRLGVAAGQVTPDSNKLEIVSVSALDDSNKYLEIVFSKPVSGLQTSDITVKNADTMARYGIKSVQMSSNNLTATVELYSQEDDVAVLEYLQDYNVTVNANGTILSFTFNRPYSQKVRVIDINPVDKEMKVAVDKGLQAGTVVTLDVPDSFKLDYQAALGELAQVWYDGDNELVNFKLLTTTSKVDAIEVSAEDEITLLGEDEEYDISEEEFSGKSKDKFLFYVNGEEVDVEDVVDEKYNFAKVGFDTSGDVEFISAYTLRDFLIVDSVNDDDEVIGVEGSSDFDASDATIIKDGKVIAPADLKKGDLLFFNEDADEDGYAEVLNNKVASGEIEEVYADSIEVDGETYDFDYDSEVAEDFDYEQGGAVYIDEDGEVADVDSDAAEELQAAGDVALYADYAGNLIYISGDTALVESNSKVAALTKDIIGYKTARDKIEIEAVNSDEDELSFDMDLEDFDTITVDGEEYDIDNDGSNDWTASLNTAKDAIVLSDNTDNKADVTISFDDEADAGSLVKLHLDDDGNLEEIEFFSGDSEDEGTKAIPSGGIEAGDKYVNGYKLVSGTVLFDATEDGVDTDADDYEVTTFGDYDGSDIVSGNYIYNDDQEVVAIWYDKTDSSDTTYDEAVVTKILRNTDDEVVSLTVFAGGKEQTYKVDDVAGFEKSSDLAKGDVVILEFDEDNSSIVKDIATADSDIDDNFADRVITGLSVKTVDVGSKEVTFTNGDTYKLADNGLVLDGYDNNDITDESLSDLRGETNVTIVKDAKTGKFVKFFVMEPAGQLSLAPINTAITAANAAKVVTSVDGSDVAVGTKWVTATVQANLTAAIQTATNAKTTVDTAAEVTAAANALDAAVAVYEAAKADGTKGVVLGDLTAADVSTKDGLGGIAFGVKVDFPANVTSVKVISVDGQAQDVQLADGVYKTVAGAYDAGSNEIEFEIVADGATKTVTITK